MPSGVTPYLTITFIGVPMLGALYAAPLILARRWWGRLGLWFAAAASFALMAWAIADQDPSVLHQTPDDLALTTSILLGFAIGPAYLVDRASLRVPLPPVWKRIMYSIGGFYLGTAVVFVGAAALMILVVLVKRLT
jgi:hypothetical protein